MKKLIFVSLIGMLSICSAYASDPVTCVKQVGSDATVIPGIKTSIKSDFYAARELDEYAIQLCVRASTAYDPIACVKSAESDSSAIAGIKAAIKDDFYAARELDEYAIKLCGK